MRGGALAAALLAAALAIAPAALAHDTYVDASDGKDGGRTCKKKTRPCATIKRGLARAGHGDTVFVGGDRREYTTPLELSDGKSIKKKDFSNRRSVDTSGQAILDTGSAPGPAIDVSGDAGTVKGLHLRSSNDRVIEVGADVTLLDDVFDKQADHSFDVLVVGCACEVRIEDSTFKDRTPTDERTGIGLASPASARIKHNDFTGLYRAIGSAGAATITDNTITGTHVSGMFGWGISVSGPSATATLRRNVLSEPAPGPVGTRLFGVDVTSVPAGLEMTRNLIDGYTEGVRSQDSGELVMDSDAITNSTTSGLTLIDSGAADAGLGNAQATNVTINDSGFGTVDAEDHTHLDLDSSIIAGAPIQAFGDATCTITFSRGESVGSGCNAFQTAANPKLKADGYHLKESSPLIDAGNPAAPVSGARDIDGDPRALDGTGRCRGAKVRDIGADEFRC